MKIRSVTCFANAGDPTTQADMAHRAGQLARDAQSALESAGFPVQTTRLATQPLSHLSADPLQTATELWAQCTQAGFEYLSLGPILADAPDADLSRLDDAAWFTDHARPLGTTLADQVRRGILAGIHHDQPHLGRQRLTESDDVFLFIARRDDDGDLIQPHSSFTIP